MRQTFRRVEIIEVMIRVKGFQIHNIKTNCEILHLVWALIKTYFLKILVFQYYRNFSTNLIIDYYIFIQQIQNYRI